MEHDPGRTAMWICGALLGLLRAKGLVTDHEIMQLSDGLAWAAMDESPEVRVDMEWAAEWLGHSVPVAND